MDRWPSESRNKRRKMSSSPIEIPDSQGDDTVAGLMPTERREHVPVTGRSRRQSSSQGLKKPEDTLASFGQPTEFQRLEMMLRTGISSADRGLPTHESEPSVEEIPQSLLSKPPQRLVRPPKRRRLDPHNQSLEDIVDDNGNDLPYRGTMNLLSPIKRPNSISAYTPQLQLTTGYKSQHFDLGRNHTTKNGVESSSDFHRDSKPFKIDDDTEYSNLLKSDGNGTAQYLHPSDQYRSTDHNDMLGSEDELQHDKQIEKAASVANKVEQGLSISQHVDKFMQNRTQKKSQDHNLSVGTIIPTTFTSSRHQQASQQRKLRRREPDGFRVQRIRNQDFESKSQNDADILLRYNEDRKAFVLTGVPQDILDIHPNLTILPEKVNKIKHGTDNPALIQLELMRSMFSKGTQDLKVDLEMRDDSIGSKFLESIQRYSGPIKIESLPTYDSSPI